MGETSHIGGEKSSVGAKRLTGERNVLNWVVTATGLKRLENGCETSWGAKHLWCEMSWSQNGGV